MKVFGFKITTLAAFGAGFVLGSRAGPGPWEMAVKKWNQVQGTAERHLGNGQIKDRFEMTREGIQEATGGVVSEV